MKNDRQNTKMLKGIKAKLLKNSTSLYRYRYYIHYCDFLYGF